jgi:hypothetical protein
MSTADKIVYTLGFMVPIAMIAAMIAPSFMSLENSLKWERAMENITFGVIGIALWIMLVVAPVVFCILAIVSIWMEPRP